MDKPQPPRVIGLYSSVPQCGKSTVARWLLEKSEDWVSLQFARGFKCMLMSLLHQLDYRTEQIDAMVYGCAKDAVIQQIGQSPRQRGVGIRVLGSCR